MITPASFTALVTADPMRGVNVTYTCAGCAAIRVEVQVRFRDPGESVRDWMFAAKMACALDHDHRSPYCAINEFKSLKVPMQPGAKVVGAPPLS